MNNKDITELIRSRVDTLSRARGDEARNVKVDENRSQAFGTIAKNAGDDILRLAKLLGLHDLSATIKEVKPYLRVVSKAEAEAVIDFMRKQDRLLNQIIERVKDINAKLEGQKTTASMFPNDVASAKDAAIKIVNSNRAWFTSYAENGGGEDRRIHEIARVLSISWLNAGLKEACEEIAMDA